MTAEVLDDIKAIGYKYSTKAAMTESYAKSEAAKSNTYTKNGTYNYNYNSGNIFTDMF